MYKDAIDLALKSGKGFSKVSDKGGLEHNGSQDENFAEMEKHIVREDVPDTTALEAAVEDLGPLVDSLEVPATPTVTAIDITVPVVAPQEAAAAHEAGEALLE